MFKKSKPQPKVQATEAPEPQQAPTPVTQAEFEQAIRVIDRAVRSLQIRSPYGTHPLTRVAFVSHHLFHAPDDSRQSARIDPYFGCMMDQAVFISDAELREEQKKSLAQDIEAKKSRIAELTAELDRAARKLGELE